MARQQLLLTAVWLPSSQLYHPYRKANVITKGGQHSVSKETNYLPLNIGIFLYNISLQSFYQIFVIARWIKHCFQRFFIMGLHLLTSFLSFLGGGGILIIRYVTLVQLSVLEYVSVGRENYPITATCTLTAKCHTGIEVVRIRATNLRAVSLLLVKQL